MRVIVAIWASPARAVTQANAVSLAHLGQRAYRLMADQITCSS
jgi:hypothetical protein